MRRRAGASYVPRARWPTQSRRRPVRAVPAGRPALAGDRAHVGFSRLVEQGLHLVGALDDAGLRDAIERPARQAGLLLEPGLVDLLVREVRDDPGALPLLSHALVETWQRREGNTLTVEGYHASGGIHGAVAQSAELLYSRSSPSSGTSCATWSCSSSHLASTGEPVRTRVPAPARGRRRRPRPLDRAARRGPAGHRDEGVLEITHEALARAWPRLRGWLEDDVEGQQVRHHLSGAADAWQALGRPSSELYRGVRLTRALDWRARTRSTLTETEKGFLEAARAQSEAEEQSAVARAREQARLISRLRQVLAGASCSSCSRAPAGCRPLPVGPGRRQRGRGGGLGDPCRRPPRRCERAGHRQHRHLPAPRRRRHPSGPRHRHRNSLLAAIGKRPELFASTPIEGDLPLGIDASADGKYVAILDESHHLRLYDASTGGLVGDRQEGAPRSPSAPRWDGRSSSARTAAGWPCRGPPTAARRSTALGAHPRPGTHVARPAGSRVAGHRPVVQWRRAPLRCGSPGQSGP